MCVSTSGFKLTWGPGLDLNCRAHFGPDVAQGARAATLAAMDMAVWGPGERV